MKNRLFIIFLALLFAGELTAQGLEQYCYLEKGKSSVWVPMMHYQNDKGWYVEGRYNYESLNSFSLYGGREFFRKGEISTSITPLIGGVIGDFTGISAGMNLSADYKKLFFACQSQYTMSSNSKNTDFFFSWSELAYEPVKWLYLGLSAQHTYCREDDTTLVEPGAVAGFRTGKWTFPVYCFNVADDKRYFVLGINLDLGDK